MSKVCNNKSNPVSVSQMEEKTSAPDREFQRLEQGYVHAKEQLIELERKCASEIEIYGEDRFLNDPNWHKLHYEASEAVRSAKYWLDAYTAEVNMNKK